MMPRFLNESSQMRKRAYTVCPVNWTEMIFSVGRPFGGGVVGATTAVGAEVAVALPLSFFAVTTTRSRKPRSDRRTPYEVPVAPAMLVQTTASTLQSCHWYANEVGLPLHVPLEAVSVCPTVSVPLIVGGAVLTGAAALATPANTSATTTTIAVAASRATAFDVLAMPSPSSFAI